MVVLVRQLLHPLLPLLSHSLKHKQQGAQEAHTREQDNGLVDRSANSTATVVSEVREHVIRGISAKLLGY